MKKLLGFLIIINFMLPVMAEEGLNTIQPEQKFDDNRASISVQKQPTLENTQRQSVKNNRFCIIVQVNGKVLETLPQLQE